jgi:hypothetical protein
MTGPLTLEGMRAEGVHSVTYDCLCRPENDEMNVDHLPGHIAVPDVREYIRCSGCGERPLRTMPLWQERGITPGYPV